jgi:cytochrome c-type biogenesis protein CcmF
VAAELEVADGHGGRQTLAPRMNFYERSTDPVGSPAIRSAAFEDLYLTLLAFDSQANSASFNAWIFPMVSWIWWSLPFFVFGALLAGWPERRRVRVPSAETAKVSAARPTSGATA